MEGLPPALLKKPDRSVSSRMFINQGSNVVKYFLQYTDGDLSLRQNFIEQEDMFCDVREFELDYMVMVL